MCSSDRPYPLRARRARTGRALLVVLALASGGAHAADPPPVIGPVYPIHEPDLLATIMARLEAAQASGELARREREAITRAQASLHAPRPVAGLRTTEQPRSYEVDPTVVAPRDVLAPDGTPLARAGERINPLDHVPLASMLLFFDGREAAQRARARELVARHRGRVKPILVAGPVVALSREWGERLYFDQGGVLVRRLGIRQVPALVAQAGRVLRVEELRP